MLSTRYKAIKLVSYLLAAIVLCVLQNTPGLFVIAGIKPMLLVAFAVCVTMFEKETIGGLIGAFCGMLCDLFSSYTFGFYALAIFSCCVLVGLLTQSFIRTSMINSVLFTIVTIVFIQYIGFFFTMQIWDVPDAMSYFVTRLLPMCAYTSATSLLLYFPTRAVHLYFEERIALA